METTISKLFKYKPLPKYVGLEGPTRVKHKDVFVGVEIEVENFKTKGIFHKPSTINVHDDNSLKIAGMELVTVPLKLRYLEIELSRVLNQLDSHILLSSRCSTHVHMNVRDMTPTQIGNMVLLYIIFERSLYQLCGNRWNNNFCVPLYMCHELVNFWFRNEYHLGGWMWKKYTGLNLCPIWGGESTKIGTVEFRQMEGTIDIPRIIDWCNLITALKRAAQEMDREELYAHIRIMRTTSGYWWLVKKVFGSWSTMLTNQPTFAEDVEDSITNLKTILWAKKPKAAKKGFIKPIAVAVADTNTVTDGPDMVSAEELASHWANNVKQFVYPTTNAMEQTLGL